MERLRELYVLGDFTRDAYMAAGAGKMAELEQELGGADYPLEAALTRINRMGELLRDETRKQQRRAINLLFDKILVGDSTKSKGVELQNWAQPLFVDLLMVGGDTVCPRDLERTPCRHPCRAQNSQRRSYHNRRKPQNGFWSRSQCLHLIACCSAIADGGARSSAGTSPANCRGTCRSYRDGTRTDTRMASVRVLLCPFWC